jgi:hypothetical protein
MSFLFLLSDAFGRSATVIDRRYIPFIPSLPSDQSMVVSAVAAFLRSTRRAIQMQAS